MLTNDRPAAASILIVDLEPETSGRVTRVVRELGLTPITVIGSAEALRRVREAAPALAVVGLAPGDATCRIVEQLVDAHIPVIVLADAPGIRSVVGAMRAGATDVIDRQRAAEELRGSLETLLPLTARRVAADGTAARDAFFHRYDALFDRSDKMRALEPAVARLAAISVPILIRGEEGVGKEGVAAAIHCLSARSARRFVKVACSSLPSEVLEAELPVMIQAADGGSLFLDEVGVLSPAAQAELGRVMDVGGGSVRFVSSTSADMYALVASGRFRGDLYERLAVATLDVAPLRQRTEEVVPLATRFLERFSHELDRPAPDLTEDMAEALRRYPWPGNIRELENLMKRWVALGTASHIREELDARAAAAARTRRPTNGAGLGLRDIAREAAREAERHALQAALHQAKGNRAAVARQLRVSYKTLLQKLSDTGLSSTAKGRRRV